MSLQVEMKPGERFVLGEYIITSTARTRLVFHNENVAILREKDVLRPEQAVTRAQRIYYALQRVYTSKDEAAKTEYSALCSELASVLPSSLPFIERINRHVVDGALYKALKETRELMLHEGEHLSAVQAGKI
jgi:flagellar biosynthesis repressor protein FlbT